MFRMKYLVFKFRFFFVISNVGGDIILGVSGWLDVGVKNGKKDDFCLFGIYGF